MSEPIDLDDFSSFYENVEALAQFADKAIPGHNFEDMVDKNFSESDILDLVIEEIEDKLESVGWAVTWISNSRVLIYSAAQVQDNISLGFEELLKGEM